MLLPLSSLRAEGMRLDAERAELQAMKQQQHLQNLKVGFQISLCLRHLSHLVRQPNSLHACRPLRGLKLIARDVSTCWTLLQASASRPLYVMDLLLR